MTALDKDYLLKVFKDLSFFELKLQWSESSNIQDDIEPFKIPYNKKTQRLVS